MPQALRDRRRIIYQHASLDLGVGAVLPGSSARWPRKQIAVADPTVICYETCLEDKPGEHCKQADTSTEQHPYLD
jgi:hypothetical protein